MVKKSTHLTYNDRVRSETLLGEDASLRYIAECLDKSPSTISREIKRHAFFLAYGWKLSMVVSVTVRSKAHKVKKITTPLVYKSRAVILITLSKFIAKTDSADFSCLI